MGITLRKTNSNDIKFLNEIRGKENPKLHDYRLEQQEEDRAVYLIAFQDEKPVGHVFVIFEGSEKYHNSPALQDLCVIERLRGQHIGTEMINATERYLKCLGYKEMCLDVETKEEGLYEFYGKLNFKQKGGPYRQGWTEKDTGKKIEVDVFYLQKRIK